MPLYVLCYVVAHFDTVICGSNARKTLTKTFNSRFCKDDNVQKSLS